MQTRIFLPRDLDHRFADLHADAVRRLDRRQQMPCFASQFEDALAWLDDVAKRFFQPVVKISVLANVLFAPPCNSFLLLSPRLADFAQCIRPPRGLRGLVVVRRDHCKVPRLAPSTSSRAFASPNPGATCSAALYA